MADDSLFSDASIYSAQLHVQMMRTVSLVTGSAAAGTFRQPMMEELAPVPTVEEISEIIESDARELGLDEYGGPPHGISDSLLFPTETLGLLSSGRRPLVSARTLSRYPSNIYPMPSHQPLVVRHHRASGVLEEAGVLGSTALPLMVSFLLQNSLSVALVFCAGRLGPGELSAVTLGSMALTVSGFAVVQGLSTSLDTLCAQAYGAGRLPLVGVYFQRCSCLILACFVPIAVFWMWGAPYVLAMLVPEPRLVELASLYLRYILLGVPGFVLFETGKRFLQAQGIFHATPWILMVAVPLNAVLNYVLVLSLVGVGFIGAPIAVSITYTSMALGLLGFVYVIRDSEYEPLRCWDGVDLKLATMHWGTLLRLGVPGTIMVVLEFLAFEAMTFMSAYLGPVELAAQSVVATLGSVSFQIPFAVGIATSTRVANLIGAALPSSARHTARVSVPLGVCFSAINFSVLTFGRHWLAGLFTDDAAVAEMVVRTLPAIAVISVFDEVMAVTCGIMRGQGRQAFGSKLNLAVYYGVGLPLSVFLGFHTRLGLVGLWAGVGGALSVIGLIQWVYVLHVDWTELVREAQLRSG